MEEIGAFIRLVEPYVVGVSFIFALSAMLWMWIGQDVWQTFKLERILRRNRVFLSKLKPGMSVVVQSWSGHDTEWEEDIGQEFIIQMSDLNGCLFIQHPTRRWKAWFDNDREDMVYRFKIGNRGCPW